MHRSLAVATSLVLGATLLAGCGDDDKSTSTSSSSSTVATQTSSTPTTQPVDAPSVSTPATSETAYLKAVDTAMSGQTETVTFTFDGKLPGYSVEYLDHSPYEETTGNPVSVTGTAFLRMNFQLASTVKLTGGLTKVYTGSDRIAPSGTTALKEIVKTGDNESNLTWVAGLDKKRRFRVAPNTGLSTLTVSIDG